MSEDSRGTTPRNLIRIGDKRVREHPGRIMREIRRRNRVVGAFPDRQSALNLAAARLRHIAGTRWSTKRYLNVTLIPQNATEALTA